jgi:HK97 family phage major capsid protein
MSEKRRQRLNQLLTDIAAKNNEINAIFDGADKRGDTETKEEITQIKSLQSEVRTLEDEAAELRELVDIHDGAQKRQSHLNEPNRPQFHGSNGDEPGSHPAFKSLAESVLDADAMKSWLAQYKDRPASAKTNIQSPTIEVKSLLQSTKALVTGGSATSGGALVFPDFKPIVDTFYARPLTVKDLITMGETTGDTVEYVRVTGVTNNAAPVAEATAAGDGTGAKPESALALARITETVKTIAHWVPATNRALSDAGQLRTLIDNFLRYGLEEELEDQIINGSGNGEDFEGILSVSTIATQAWDTDILKTTRKARTKVRTEGRTAPTAYVLNPLDWETIDLLQDNEARYYFGGPSQIGAPRLWGLPVVESEGITAGTGIVANWKMAILWDRMQTMISMSNSHSDFFVRNLVAILAELRAAFGVIRPKAFVEIDTAA